MKLIAGVLLVGGITWWISMSGFDVTRVTPEKIRILIRSFGMWAPLVYLLGYAQPIVLMPASVLSMAGGLVFGPVWGTLAALCGSTLRACTQFGLARLLGRETIAKWLKGRAAALDARINASGFYTVLVIRLVPNVPFDLQNFGLGFSMVRFSSYLAATVAGLIPSSIAFAYCGAALTDPRQRAMLWVVMGLLIISTLAPIVWKSRRARRRPVQEPIVTADLATVSTPS